MLDRNELVEKNPPQKSLLIDLSVTSILQLASYMFPPCSLVYNSTYLISTKQLFWTFISTFYFHAPVSGLYHPIFLADQLNLNSQAPQNFVIEYFGIPFQQLN